MSVPATAVPAIDRDYTLEHKYTRTEGRIYLSGVQALVRLPLMQRLRDQAAGLNTAGFVSGYRGSPLGGVDLELWRAKKLIEENKGWLGSRIDRLLQWVSELQQEAGRKKK